jgi:hypothetical protein
LKAIITRLQLNDSIELHCSAAIMPVFWICFKSWRYWLKITFWKVDWFFVFRFRAGKKNWESNSNEIFQNQIPFFDNEKGNTQSTFKSTMIQLFVKENRNHRKDRVCMNLFVFRSLSEKFVSIFLHKRKWIQWIREWVMNEQQSIFKWKRYIKTFQFFYKKIGNKVKVSSKNESTIAMKVDFYILVRI